MARRLHGRNWLAAALVLLPLLAGIPATARAADQEGGRRTGLLRSLRDRLTGRGGPEALREAMLVPDAGAARDVIEGLAGRGGDAETAARAALWMGHYHYGAGDADAALAWFEKARSAGGGPAERAEADFWRAQCRNLLGHVQEAEPPSEGESVSAVLGRVARLDGELRVGRVESALRGYIALESAARRAGCLGPILYRLGLAAATGAGERDLGWATVEAWAPSCADAPEYALVQSMRESAAPSPAPAPPAERDSVVTPFVEPTGGPPADAGSHGGASGDDGNGFVPGTNGRPAAPGNVPDGAGVAGGAGSAGSAPTSGGPGDAGDEGGEFAVQLGSFHDAARADREARRLEGLGLQVRVEEEDVGGETWHRLRLGRYHTREEAEESALARCTGLDWRIVRIGP